MKLRLTLLSERGASRDVALISDVTATVADIAHALIRSGGTEDPRLAELALHRVISVTLSARPTAASTPILLDPGTPLGASGLQSGWLVTPVAEFGVGTKRLIEIACHIQVLTGRHSGAQFSAIRGSNLIGRERSCRIHLSDESVSRRHAVLQIDDRIRLRDLGSANGMQIGDEPVGEHEITVPCTVTLGEVVLRITPVQPTVTGATPPLSHRVLHTRAPRVSPHFVATRRELPAPTSPSPSNRIPVLALLMPMMMGGAMYAVTQSPMSLIMMAFSPAMMIGSWLDGRLSGKKKLRRDTVAFEQNISAARAELIAMRDREISVRNAETPTLAEVTTAIIERNSLLWARRPEHRSFLEIRFGEGTLPSRTEIALPSRGDTSHKSWAALRGIEAEFCEITPVPVRERLDHCGSIGVAGEPPWAEGLARALIMQLVGLHSPAELTIACFAGPEQAREWAWLKWLPHAGAVTSPLSVWPLANDVSNSTRLILALESLLEMRRAEVGKGATIRSHLSADNHTSDAQSEHVTELPCIPAVVVLVLETGQVEQARLIGLAETGPDYGIHLIWVAGHVAEIPAACRTFVEITPAGGSVSFVRTGATVKLQHYEQLTAQAAGEAARRLSPMEDSGARMLDESDLPRSVDLRELHEIDLVGGAQAILQAWSDTGSLTAQWQLGKERGLTPLRATIGQGPDGPMSIDLRAQGPHALVGGTTGSGKSEFLQTWIMSLAANVSPERVTFLLVDYKGGAAFAECVDLPHTVGLVTDLSPHLVHRALISLRAELRYREELLAQHGAKDLVTMERRSDAAAPPTLVVVIDEFAALAAEVPEFVDGVIDVAQRGRSLGLHLIMATQRPAAVITDNLRANTNLRIALRMADEADSADVIAVKDAAFFTADAPGRGAIKIGPGRLQHFQTGYLGGRSIPLQRDPLVHIRSLDFAEGEVWDLPPGPQPRGIGRNQPRDIEQLRDSIAEAAQTAGLVQPRRPWLNPLPDLLDLATLTEVGQHEEAAIGLRDEPQAQAQPTVTIDFEEAGNIAFIGAGGSGKTSALITLTASLSCGAAARPVHIYAIDAAGGSLDAMTVLPTVGAVASLSDTELVGRILRRMLDLIAERGPRYAAARASGLTAYRRTRGESAEPRVVLLVDGFGTFRQAMEALGQTDSPLQMLSEVMMTGRAVGVHVVLTSDRPSVIPAAMASSLQQSYVLRLANALDYGYVGVNGDRLIGAPAGRALLAGHASEAQIALLGGSRGFSGQSQALEKLATELRTAGVEPATRVHNAPEQVALRDLPIEAEGRPVYAIDTRDFSPVTMPMRGLAVVAGPAGSGLSSACLSCVAAVERLAQARGQRVETVLLSFAPDGLRTQRRWGCTAIGAEEVHEVARQLVVALGGRLGRPEGGAFGALGVPPAADPVEEPVVFPSAGAHGVIVVERPAEAEGTKALVVLVALAKVARRAGVFVLYEFEHGNSQAIWDLFSALKQPRWGLALQPDSDESQSLFRESFGRVRRSDFPPGRGFAVETGRVTPVHLARVEPLEPSEVF